MLKIFTLAFCLFFVACTEQTISVSNLPTIQNSQKIPQKIQKTKNTHNVKEGYYFAKKSTPTCVNADIWVHLQPNDQNVLVDLQVQCNESEKKDEHTRYEAFWVNDDSVLKLKDNFLFVGKDFITFIEDENQMLKNENTLERLLDFHSDNLSMFVSKKSVRYGKSDGKKAFIFDAVVNLKQPLISQNKEYFSFLSFYQMQCESEKYRDFDIVYFQKPFAFGEKLSENLQQKYHFQDTQLLQQVRKNFCDKEND